MSYTSNKGYYAEHSIEEYLKEHGYVVWRPRTTSRSKVDTGDIRGLPLVLSVKNHARIQLAACVDELTQQVDRSEHYTGLLIHKRVGKGRPGAWYATTTVQMAIPLIDAYASHTRDLQL